MKIGKPIKVMDNININIVLIYNTITNIPTTEILYGIDIFNIFTKLIFIFGVDISVDLCIKKMQQSMINKQQQKNHSKCIFA